MGRAERLIKQRESISLTGLICSRCGLSWISCICQNRRCSNCCWYRDEKCLMRRDLIRHKRKGLGCSEFVEIESDD
jgi:hypothetical protein